MIYGDNPQKINQSQDALGLTTYTYVPQITAIAQSGNLYVYTVNDPIRFRDADGESLFLSPILVGALVGGIFNAGVNVFGQLQSGQEINLASVGLAFGAGAISGAAAGSGLNRAGQIILNAVLGGSESVLQDIVNNRKIDIGQFIMKTVIGGLAGVAGGPGAQDGTRTCWKLYDPPGYLGSLHVHEFPVSVKAAFKAFIIGFTKSTLTQLVITFLSSKVTSQGG